MNVYRYFNDSECRVRLENIEFIEEGGRYYFDMSYIVEDAKAKRRLHLPRVYLPIRTSNVSLDMSNRDLYSVNIGLGDLFLHPDEDWHYLFETVLEEKVHDMTIAEIEKKLGHKIKIVG